MTTVHEIRDNVHYRRLPQMSNSGPSNVANSSLDVTGRLCVPCAIVGTARDAAGASNDGVPLCAGHVEFYGLSYLERAGLVAAFSAHRCEPLSGAA